MPKIKAFRGIRYNPEKTEMGKALCPPYDVISEEQADALYNETPTNCIRLEFGKEYPKDSKEDNRYTRAKADFDQWLKDEVLIQDEAAALYYHEHYFLINDKECMRSGLVASTKIDEDDRKYILPHETTHKGPKVDRLHLLNAVKANLSCVFGIYSDPEKLIELKVKPALGAPTYDFEAHGDHHKVWAISDESLVSQIQAMMEEKNVLIADGHHRYETAKIYRDRMRAASGQTDGDQPFDYVMVYMTNSDEGLTILPTHRVIEDSMGVGLVDLEYRIKEIFNMIPHDNRKSFLKALQEGGAGHIGLYVKGIQRYYLLELHEDVNFDKYMAKNTHELLQKLDLNVLHSCIIEPILGIDTHTAGKRITYISNSDEALEMIEKEAADIAFLLNPTSITDIMEIAEAGLKMPQKSTYFYPKIPTGLVFHPVA